MLEVRSSVLEDGALEWIAPATKRTTLAGETVDQTGGMEVAISGFL